MAVDLRVAGFVNVESMVIGEEAVMFLEQQGSKDRMRKITYDEIEYVTIEKEIPWVAAAIFGTLFGGSGAIVLYFGLSENPEEYSVLSFGVFMMIAFIFYMVRYFLFKRTILSIVYGENRKKIGVIHSPWKIKAVTTRLFESIKAWQAYTRARRQNVN